MILRGIVGILEPLIWGIAGPNVLKFSIRHLPFLCMGACGLIASQIFPFSYLISYQYFKNSHGQPCEKKVFITLQSSPAFFFPPLRLWLRISTSSKMILPIGIIASVKPTVRLYNVLCACLISFPWCKSLEVGIIHAQPLASTEHGIL